MNSSPLKIVSFLALSLHPCAFFGMQVPADDEEIEITSTRPVTCSSVSLPANLPQMLIHTVENGLIGETNGLLELMESAHRQDLAVTVRNDNAQDLVVIALINQRFDVARMLLEFAQKHGVFDLWSFCDTNGKNLFHFVAQYGSAEFVRYVTNLSFLLPNMRELINSQNQALQAPMHYAATRRLNNSEHPQTTEIISALLRADARPDVADYLNRNPLHHAAVVGNRAAALRLLQPDALPHINAQVPDTDEEPHTPSELARIFEHPEIDQDIQNALGARQEKKKEKKGKKDRSSTRRRRSQLPMPAAQPSEATQHLLHHRTLSSQHLLGLLPSAPNSFQ